MPRPSNTYRLMSTALAALATTAMATTTAWATAEDTARKDLDDAAKRCDDDAHRWRKYGHKKIGKRDKTSNDLSERSYYRCSFEGCPARKRVGWCPETGHTRVWYEFEHTCGQVMRGPCSQCGTKESPQWRRGTCAKPVLCNACGVRYRKTQAVRDETDEMNAQGPVKKRPMVTDPANNDVGEKRANVVTSNGQVARIKRGRSKKSVPKELLSAAKRVVELSRAPEGNSLFQHVLIPRAPRTSATVATKPLIPAPKPLTVPEGVRNIRLFARVQTENGNKTVLKPVRVMVSSQVEVEKLRTQLTIRDASLKAERARAQALEAKVNFLRAQLECKALRARLRETAVSKAPEERPRSSPSMNEQAREKLEVDL